MSESNRPIAEPTRGLMLLETRAAVDAVRMIGPLIGARLRPPAEGGGRRVVLVPGFGSDDRYLAPLRHYLNRAGFRAEGWGLGKNLAGTDLPHRQQDLPDHWQFDPKPDYRGEGGVPILCDRLTKRVRERFESEGARISLVGWSLGGYLAREVARDLPDIVDRVVTMGSPVVGGPKYTAAATIMRKRGLDLDWIEAQIPKREAKPIEQPITAIFSRSDAVVSWKAAIDRYSRNVRHIEVDAAHLGMGFNPTIWAHVLTALEADLPAGAAA